MEAEPIPESNRPAFPKTEDQRTTVRSSDALAVKSDPTPWFGYL